MASNQDRGDERLIIIVLAAISLTCILGIIALRALKVGGSDEALVTIASLAAGALASRISQKAAAPKQVDGTEVEIKSKPTHDPMEDDFAVIGRAATKQIIAEAMRTMGGSSSYLKDDPPT